VFNVLKNLLILDGERLSYRSLDVEQIGSVYETMMGFDLEVANGTSIALKPSKPHGAPPAVNLDALLAVKPADRAGWLKSEYDQAVTGAVAEGVKTAGTIDDLLAALEKRIAVMVTPNVVPKGAMVLQPSNERRRSGSHYTPRSLTAPIVQTTLEPILRQLGPSPTPEQLLDLKVCDPAMGSGAFLVETCRQLGAKLEESWTAHGLRPDIPPDEDGVLHAQRLIAQRCLYGVDKNPMAVDLAKLSLWLATLAKDHPFTFLDHSLRCGDSLVGLSQEQIGAVHWKPSAQGAFLSGQQREALERAAGYRREILEARDDMPYDELRRRLDMAESALAVARFIGDAVVAAFFAGKDGKSREAARREVGSLLQLYFDKDNSQEDARKPLDAAISNLRAGRQGIAPFHWHIEFPEVFAVDALGKPTRGFDAIVGNPPFAGKNTIAAGNPTAYPDWLQALHAESHGNADLVAHFFRRAFDLLRHDGAFGLIATNTIGQGDTRSTGLRWICTHGGEIYDARKRVKWPGLAAVIVSVVHVTRGIFSGKKILNLHSTNRISAFLFHQGGDDDPIGLVENKGRSFIGCFVLGMGFTFDDSDTKGIASPLSEMERILDENPHNREIIFPYLGGEEVNNSPTQSHNRYIINFGDRDESECRRRWPEALAIVERRVKPERMKL